jgi:hypothetical protein
LLKQTSDKSEQAMSEIIIEAHTTMIEICAKPQAWSQNFKQLKTHGIIYLVLREIMQN